MLDSCCHTYPRVEGDAWLSPDELCTLVLSGKIDSVSRTLQDYAMEERQINALGSAMKEENGCFVGIRMTPNHLPLHDPEGNRYVMVEDLPFDRKYRATAIQFAVLMGDVDMVAILLESGADPTVRSEQGFTAREMALSLQNYVPTMGKIAELIDKAPREKEIAELIDKAPRVLSLLGAKEETAGGLDRASSILEPQESSIYVSDTLGMMPVKF